MLGAQGGRYSDFLIIKNPDAVRIYNQYQQTIDVDDFPQFSAYVPLRIIDERARLSDDITEVVQCTLFDDAYYILRGRKSLLPDAKSNTYTRVKRCRVIGDTLQILTDGAISVNHGLSAAETESKTTLNKGDVVIRLFRKDRQYFLAQLGRPSRYGWSALSDRSAWEKIQTTSESAVNILPHDLKIRIVQRIESANHDYQTFFRDFNRRFEADKSIPQWVIETETNVIRARLNQQTYINQLSRSTHYLVRDLETMLLASPFELIYNDGVIVIKSKAGKS